MVGMPTTRQHASLISMLICLTLLLLLAQLALFFVHYNVSDLLDSLIKSSMANTLSHAVVILPIIQFILIQLAAYALWVAWIWLVAVSVGGQLRLSSLHVYFFGMTLWMVSAVFLFSANAYFYQHSYFATWWFDHTGLGAGGNEILLVVTAVLQVCVALLAACQFLRVRRHVALVSIFIAFGSLLVASSLYDRWLLHASPVMRTHTAPNIILIGLDSLRPDFTSYFGYQKIKTPNIDNFLASATTFTDVYTPLARTFPAWVSILTAQYPKHNHVRENLANPDYVLARETLAKRLQQAGYETIYATDEKRFSNITRDYGFNRVLGPAMGLDDFIVAGLSDFPLTNLLLKLPIARFIFPYHFGNRAADITYDPENFLRLVKLDLLRLPNKPVFLAIHLCISHWPFRWANDNQRADDRLPQLYERSVQAVDTQLGDLMQLLKTAGLLENSLVVLLSDHGTTLGLPNDRLVSREKHLGNRHHLALLSTFRLSSAPADTFNFKRDYRMDTSYGQGTDVLSLKQYRALLGFRGFGLQLPVQQVKATSSLLDIAPTVLDVLGMPSLKQADGVSLKSYFSVTTRNDNLPRTIFLETGASMAEIETDDIHVDKVVQREIGAYALNPATGLLFLTAQADSMFIANKQRAILRGNWLLARYPAMLVNPVRLAGDTRQLKRVWRPPYFVLVNLHTGQWSVGLTSAFAHTAPLAELLRMFQAFYGDEASPNFIIQ